MVRVIGGEARGVPLKMPKGNKTRPTTDRIKESIFNILGPRVVAARVLDLYAGTGALGIEALSRGAQSALFVERDGRCAALVRENLEKARLSARGEVLLSSIPPRGDLPDRDGSFDLVFMDPPYDRGELEKALGWLDSRPLCAPQATIVVERSPKEEIPSILAKLELVREKEYRETVISFLRST